MEKDLAGWDGLPSFEFLALSTPIEYFICILIMDFFILYRNTECTELIETLKDMNAGNRGDEKYSAALTSLLNVAYRDGFEGNLWWRLLTEALVYDENPYTLSCERRPCISTSIRVSLREK